MAATVYDFPSVFYDFVVTQKFALRPMSQFSQNPWTGGRKAREPHAQVWMTSVTMAPMRDPLRMEFDALISRLRGSSGLLRMVDVSRLAPWHDRNITATTSTFTDGSGFAEGGGFANGYLPPEVYVETVALKGARYIILGGFPASTANVLHRGDLFQIKPNGIPGSIPHLYKSMYGGNSDSSGRVGLEIEPGFRTAVSAGDTVGLRNASSVFHLVDDSQGELEMSGGGLGNGGFSLIEAVDVVS